MANLKNVIRNLASKPVLRIDDLESRLALNAVNPTSVLVGPVLEGSEITGNTNQIAALPDDGHATGCQCNSCRQFVDPAGGIYFELSPPAPQPAFVGPLPAAAPEPAPAPLADTFNLQSRPSATRKIYLDFNGHTTSGQAWNTYITGGAPIVTPAYSFEGDSSFSNNELTRIQYIWERIAEDFSPFDVDVTTKDPGIDGLTFSGGTDTTWGIRVVIGGNGSWYSPAGGVAYLNSFKSSSDITCFVFEDNLGNGNEKFIVDAASHEIGHTLGLSHDGTSSVGYYEGHSSTTNPGWAAIMGVGYYQPVTQWSKGEYVGANNTQDDLAIISGTSNGFGYRVDDVGNTTATAQELTVNGSTVSAQGVIERTTDVDVFAFTSSAGTVSFNFTPYLRDPNLDIMAELLSSTGVVLATHNPQNVMTAEFVDFNLPTSGRYYLRVSGVGAGNMSTGYSDYGSLGQYWINGTIRTGGSLSEIETSSLAFNEGDAAKNITETLSVTATGNLSKATISLVNMQANDLLVFVNQNGITSSYNAGTGVLTLNGVTTAANYQTALRSIKFQNNSLNPVTGTRTVRFSVQDASNVQSNIVERSISVLNVNDVPTLSPINNVSLLEEAGQTTVPLTGISDGGSEGQAITITAVSDNPSLIPNPTVNYTSPNATGSLVFTPVANQNGTATITVTVQDNGGTVNGGVDRIVRTFTVTVNPVNDAPSFTKGDDQFALTNSGPQVVPNWATNLVLGPPDEANQSAAFNIISNSNPSLFSEQPSISPTGTLTFTSALDATGSALIQVRYVDEGGTDNGGIDQSTVQEFVIQIGANRAPELDNIGDNFLKPVATASTDSRGSFVSDFVTGLSDRDVGTVLGIAVTDVDASNGNWFYSTNDGATWEPLDDVSLTNARLLRPTDRIRFQSLAGYVGVATLSYHAWDQFTGSAGEAADLSSLGNESPFSQEFDTATIRVAPVLIESIEDIRNTGGAIQAAIAGVGDADTLPKTGIAIIGSGGDAAGSWEYQVGTSWRPFPVISPANAFLLRSTDKVRFAPKLNATGDAYLTFRAWDQSMGTPLTMINLSDENSIGGHTAFSEGVDYLFTRVNPVNDRPIMDIAGPTAFPNITKTNNDPAGMTVSNLIGSIATDVDTGTVPGVAITAAPTRGGIWQYQSAGSNEWLPILPVTTTSALLLDPADRVRFRPDGTYSGLVSMSFKAWDRSTGVAGTRQNSALTMAFSTAIETATLLITDVASVDNSAPVLDNSTNFVLPSVAEDFRGNGTQISVMLGTAVTDADTLSKFGMAVTRLIGTENGQWQYSTNNRSWVTIPSANMEQAFLLRSTDFIRYLPNANFVGEASFEFQAWDQTRGAFAQFANPSLLGQSGGVGAFSTGVGRASITVTPVNDAPILNITPSPIFNAINPGDTNPIGTTVATLLGTALTDPDANSLQGIAVTRAVSTRGVWQFRVAGETSFTNITGLTAINMLFLRPEDELRFLPNANVTGVETIMYRGWDQSAGIAGQYGNPTGTTTLSTATESATITYNNINDRPTLQVKPGFMLPGMPMNDTLSNGFSVAAMVQNNVVDLDVNPQRGVAIVGLDVRNGRWEYSLDNGTSWVTMTNLTASRAIVLRTTDRLRFVPFDGFNGLTSIRFKAWDRTDGLAAGAFSTTTSTAYSTAIETGNLLVNTAPVLTW